MSLYKARKVGGLPLDQIAEGVETSDLPFDTDILGFPTRQYTYNLPSNASTTTSGNATITHDRIGAALDASATSDDYCVVNAGEMAKTNNSSKPPKRFVVIVHGNTWNMDPSGTGAGTHAKVGVIGSASPSNESGAYIDFENQQYVVEANDGSGAVTKACDMSGFADFTGFGLMIELFLINNNPRTKFTWLWGPPDDGATLKEAPSGRKLSVFEGRASNYSRGSSIDFRLTGSRAAVRPL